MSRIRTVKPELFKHVDLYDLEQETGLPIRLAFISLFTVADREGRFKWIPRQVKVDCLPYDEIDFSRVLDALTTRGFVEKYSVNGVDYGWITGFTAHQVINNRESPSKLPSPSEANEINALTRASRVDDACLTPLDPAQAEGKGKEGKGKDKEKGGQAADLDFSLWPESPSKDVLSQWLKLRQKQKAPVSQIVIARFAKEIHEAVRRGFTVDDCLSEVIASGWKRFEADWLKGDKQSRHPFTPEQMQVLVEKARASDIGVHVISHNGKTITVKSDGRVSGWA